MHNTNKCLCALSFVDSDGAENGLALELENENGNASEIKAKIAAVIYSKVHVIN